MFHFHYRNSNHKTPVDIAAEEGYRTIVEFFIHEGAAVESEDTEMACLLCYTTLNYYIDWKMSLFQKYCPAKKIFPFYCSYVMSADKVAAHRYT